MGIAKPDARGPYRPAATILKDALKALDPGLRRDDEQNQAFLKRCVPPQSYSAASGAFVGSRRQ